ncbi:MAG: glyoxalase superfamily protein [bacterium]
MIEFKNTTPMLKTDDIQATVDFYTKVLGFTIDTLWPEDQPTLCILDRGNVHLMFSTDADWDAPGANPTMTGQLVFDVNDVSKLHKSLEGKVKVLWGPQVYEYGRREFSIMDPNGYRLVFSEPTQEPATYKG